VIATYHTEAGDVTQYIGGHYVTYTYQQGGGSSSSWGSAAAVVAANNGQAQQPKPPLTPQQQHAQQQELLNKKCAAANMASGALWVTAGMNEGAAWVEVLSGSNPNGRRILAGQPRGLFKISYPIHRRWLLG
jgi:hypothetical protein